MKYKDAKAEHFINLSQAMIEILMRNCNSYVFVVILNKRTTWLTFCFLFFFFKPPVHSTFVFYKDVFHIKYVIKKLWFK